MVLSKCRALFLSSSSSTSSGSRYILPQPRSQFLSTCNFVPFLSYSELPNLLSLPHEFFCKIVVCCCPQTFVVAACFSDTCFSRKEIWQAGPAGLREHLRNSL